MASDIEIEIAMNIIQLTGVTTPVLLGIARYYLKNSSEMKQQMSQAGLDTFSCYFEEFFISFVVLALLPFMLAGLFLSNNSDILIDLSLFFYFAFLLVLYFLLPVGVGIPAYTYTRAYFLTFMVLFSVVVIMAIASIFLVGLSIWRVLSVIFSPVFAYVCYRLARLVDESTDDQIDADCRGYD